MHSDHQVKNGLKALWVVYCLGLMGFALLSRELETFRLDATVAVIVFAFLLAVSGAVYYDDDL